MAIGCVKPFGVPILPCEKENLLVLQFIYLQIFSRTGKTMEKLQ